MSAGTFNHPQQGYGQPGYAPPQARGKSGLAVASMVLGIIALVTFWIWGAVVFGPLAIGFGIGGRRETRREGRDGEGMATAGLWCGAIALALTVPWAVIVFAT